MDYLFYFFAIFAIMWEMTVFKDTQKVTDYMLRFKQKKTEQLDGTDWSFTVLMTGYTCWILLGLFTSQWILFLLMLAIALFPSQRFKVLKLDALLSLIVLFFIILNKFQFGIDIISLF